MQPSGSGTAAPPRAAAHKLFFALWPGECVRAQAEEQARVLDRRFQPRGRLLKAARYHLTLQFLDERAVLPRRLVEDAANAATRVRTPVFDLVLDQAGSFHNAWWLGCAAPPAGLLELWDALGVELMHSHVNVRSADGFTPHVTILRDASARLPPTPIAPLHWRVREFVLVDSQPPRPYTILHRWSLADAE